MRVPPFVVVALFAAVPALGAQNENLEERIRSWERQRVIVLQSNTPSIYARCTQRRDDAEEPSYARYGGRTGVISKVAILQDNSGPLFRLTIAMEAGDTLLLCNEEPLGFFAELDSARALIGKPVWTRGLRLLRDSASQSVDLPNLARLTIARAEWGDAGEPIQVAFRTADGKVGTLETRNIHQGYGSGFDQRWHLRPRGGWPPFLEQFHLSDPVAAHRTWPTTVWPAIRRGEVTVGMSEEQADLACGSGMRQVGVSVQTGAGAAGRILRCEFSDVFFKRFEIVNGKVARLLEQ